MDMGKNQGKGAVMVREIGTVVNYYGKISVAVVDLRETLKVYDHVAFRGATTDFEQTINSMQLDHQDIEIVGVGKEVAIKVKERVRAGDKLYRLE